MRYFHLNKNKYFCPIINLDKLWSLVGEEAREAAAAETSTAAVIDVTKYGIFKVSAVSWWCCETLIQLEKPWAWL
jgi:large subunit ribosomal protein L27Ae